MRVNACLDQCTACLEQIFLHCVPFEIAIAPELIGIASVCQCLLQVREYLNSPPDLEGDHLTAGRNLYITFLEEAGMVAGLDFSRAICLLRESMASIPGLHEAILRNDLEEAAACFRSIARAEEKAYSELNRIANATALPLRITGYRGCVSD